MQALKTLREVYDALPQPKPNYSVWVNELRAKVVTTLTTHDALKAHERESFAAFLDAAFSVINYWPAD